MLTVAIIAVALLNLAIWGYLAAYPDRPECAQRDPLTAWIQTERAARGAHRTTRAMRSRVNA